MSSVSNIAVVPPPITVSGSRQVNLGALLGIEGCTHFSDQLHALARQPASGWKEIAAGGQPAYRIDISSGLPAGVTALSATVRVLPGLIEVSQQWTCANEQARASLHASVQRVVHAAVNRPLVNVVANRIAERLQQHVEQRVEPRVFAENAVQLHVRQRMGAWS